MTINHPDLRCPLFWGKATCLPTVMAPPLCLTFAQQVKPGVFKEKLMPLKWRGLGVNWVKPHFRRWWDWDFMDPWVRSSKWCHAGIPPCNHRHLPAELKFYQMFQIPRPPDPSKIPKITIISPLISKYPINEPYFPMDFPVCFMKKHKKGRLKDPWGMHRSRSGQQLEDAIDTMLFIPGVGNQDCRGKAQNQPQFLKVYCGLSK